METATAAVGSVLPKLQAYLSSHEEDQLSDMELLSQELGRIHAALLGGASLHAPRRQQRPEEPATAWAGKARELAYDVEDAIGSLLVTRGSLGHTIEGLLQRAADLSSACPQITDIPTTVVVDHYRKQQQQPLSPLTNGEPVVVGVDGAMDGLIRRLRLRDDDQVEVVSVVGPVGMGKTCLAGAAYGVLKPRFNCAAFVSVGPDPHIPKVLERALRQLGVTKEDGSGDEQGDERQLISELGEFLRNKRYLIVLDDLWDKPSWVKIRSAVVNNNLGSRIVTTTRNLYFADEIGATYELKPLSPENSKTLFFRTVFGCEDKRPDDEFNGVADKILEKCGGIPLPIITPAKMLAGNKVGDIGEWRKVCQSIGSTLESTPDVKNMRMAVSTSYYNLLPHMRTCLLYLSIFPENYEIRRDRLIWRWIAEGFVRAGDGQGETLFELGQSYFDELVNRSMIQFLDIDFSDDGGRDEYYCSVSFPVMDFISHLSSQENFVAILDAEQRALPSEMPVRRVSVRGGRKAEDSASLGAINVPPQLRSLTAFSPATPDKSVDLNMFKFLRVLDLEGCDLLESKILQARVGSLIHLRYLSLRETRIASVPEEIGNLKFLQTLDLDGNIKMNKLPESITQLGDLLCLRVAWQTRLPSGIANLTSLEELSDATTRDSPDLLNELARLAKLRLLRMTLWRPSQSDEDGLVESLRNLRNLQTVRRLRRRLRQRVHRRGARGLGAAALPRRVSGRRRNDMLEPAARAAAVARRRGCVAKSRRRGREGARAAATRHRRAGEAAGVPRPARGAVRRHGGRAPRVRRRRVPGPDGVQVPERGRGARVRAGSHAAAAEAGDMLPGVRKTVDPGNGEFVFGLENLLCLEEAIVHVGCQESTEPEAEAALRRAAYGHPNRAAFDVTTFGEELMCFDDAVILFFPLFGRVVGFIEHCFLEDSSKDVNWC